MKVFALAILLVSICCLEGALVKRQAEEGQSEGLPAVSEETFEKMAQKFNEYFSQERIAALRTQAQTQLQELQQNLKTAVENLAALFQQWTGSEKQVPA